VTGHQIRSELVAVVRPDGYAHRLAFEYAHEMTIARVAGIGQQDLLVAVDEERHDQ
jgi:hypothetical protein